MTKVTYEVLLSYPNKTDPNYIQLRNGTAVLHETQLEELILSPDQNHTDVVPPFNAYSPAGDVEVSDAGDVEVSFSVFIEILDLDAAEVVQISGPCVHGNKRKRGNEGARGHNINT